MKNSKGEVLPQPYLDLALMRRDQKPYDAQSFMLLKAFDWSLTNEGHFFWQEVYACETPAIPAASLAELDAWRKEREIGMEVKIHPIPTEPDWKAKYELLEAEANELTSALKELGAKYDELKAGETTRNWVAECAMRLYTRNVVLTESASWDLSETWAAEGKKRGHIN